MKKKGNFRKVVSGLLAGMTMLSTVLSPMTAYAAEIQPEKKPPLYEEVKAFLRINTRIFQKEKDSSLFTWLHHMPTEVVMHFTEPMLQERLWQKNFIIIV